MNKRQSKTIKKSNRLHYRTLKIPSSFKSARRSFYNSVLLICHRGLWEAAALISHHLTVFEVTADSYWAVMALPLCLAQVPAFTRPLKYSHTLLPSLSSQQWRKGCVWAGPCWKSSLGFRSLQVHLAY